MKILPVLISFPILLPSLASAVLFEKKIDVGIKNLSVISDEINLIGEANFTRLHYSNAFMNVSFRNGQPKLYSISANPETINIAGGDFNYYFPSFSQFDGQHFKKILSDNLEFKLYNNVLNLKSDYIEIDHVDYYVKAAMIGVECFLSNNEIDIEKCLNNIQIIPFASNKTPRLEFQTKESTLDLYPTNVTIAPNDFKIDTHFLHYTTKEMDLTLSESKVICQKNWFTTASMGSDIALGCLKNGSMQDGSFLVTLPENTTTARIDNNLISIDDYLFNFDINESKIEQTGKFSVGTGKTNFKCKTKTKFSKMTDFNFQKMMLECANDLNGSINNINYNTKDFAVDLRNLDYRTEQNDVTQIHADINDISGRQKDATFIIPRVQASCNAIKDFNMSALIRDCLMDGTIDIPTIDYRDEATQTEVAINIEKANIKNNQFILNAPSISMKSPTLKATIHNVKASCSRNPEDDPLDFTLLQKRCFENSLIEIPLIEATNDKYNLKMAIKDISIDKNVLALNVPSASYELNQKSVYFDNLSFTCNPNVTFETFSELNFDNVIDNCINNTKVSIDEVKNSVGGGSKKSQYKNVYFSTANAGFYLQIKTTIMLIPTKVKFEGTISYNKETTEVIMNVTKASAGLFGKDTILFFIKNFVRDQNVKVSGNRIIVKLGE